MRIYVMSLRMRTYRFNYIGKQNYELPAEPDPTKYDTVLIWYHAFSVLLGGAELSL